MNKEKYTKPNDIINIHKKQAEIITKLQRNYSNLPKYKETILNQEKIIDRLQKVLENDIPNQSRVLFIYYIE